MGYIKNREALLSTGESELRRLALDIAEESISVADPGIAVRRLLSLERDTLRIGDKAFDLTRGQRIFVIGAGKASYPIAKAFDDLLGKRIYRGLVTCKYGYEGHLEFIQMHFAGHPVPDTSSLEAAAGTVRILKEVRAGDIVLACFTGGSSSLFASPVDGISLDDMAAATQILLTCGANIIEINDVRKHLSTVKGGKLIQSLPPGTQVVNLTVSDVIGDRLDYVTDPSVPDTSTFADVHAVFDKYKLWERLPKSVTEYIRNAGPSDETASAGQLSHLRRTDILLVSADSACVGAVDAARRFGLTPLLLSTFFEGESGPLGGNLAAIAKEVANSGNPVAAPCVLIGGGETTVTINGSTGNGGPNQEFAIGAALELAGTRGIVALGIDTDGTDGPTGHAGGIVDGHTADIARSAGVDLYAALQSHDVATALARINHEIITGSTGTNVNDLKLMVVAKNARIF